MDFILNILAMYGIYHVLINALDKNCDCDE
jgi:hypothetical protein